MDEELQERNPDCIYFLASPLTCKKGIECEYRHSEIARLNPRDCWYWLAGSCLNPSCAFRHPPLDAHAELTSKSAHPQYQCSTAVKEVNVPCYFYFSGFCNKGDRCSFLHGPDDATPASKVLKTVSVVHDIPHLENKPSAGSDAGSAHMGKLPNQSEADPNRSLGSQVKPEEDFNPSTFGNIKCHSASPHTSTSECQEAPVAMSDTLLDREGCIQIGSLMRSDQNSGEQVIGHMQEDWLESSPGFDVLIDDRSQNLGYEDDAEYLLAINKDDRQLNDLFSGCDHYYEDTEECAEFLLEQERLDCCDELDDEERFEIVREIPTSLKENTMNSILPRNRKFFPVDLELDGYRGADLRFHLWKRRAVDGSQLTHFSKRNSFSQKIYQSHELSRQYGRHKFSIGSLGKNKTRFRTTNSSGWFRQSRSDIPRQHREKRQSKRPFYSSDISRRPVARRRLNEENTKFSGPKTLDQIKEEKRKGTGNGDSSDHLRHMSRISGDFEGPKPLSEILKDKKKLCSVADNNGCS